MNFEIYQLSRELSVGNFVGVTLNSQINLKEVGLFVLCAHRALAAQRASCLSREEACFLWVGCLLFLGGFVPQSPYRVTSSSGWLPSAPVCLTRVATLHPNLSLIWELALHTHKVNILPPWAQTHKHR